MIISFINMVDPYTKSKAPIFGAQTHCIITEIP